MKDWEDKIERIGKTRLMKDWEDKIEEKPANNEQ